MTNARITWWVKISWGWTSFDLRPLATIIHIHTNVNTFENRFFSLYWPSTPCCHLRLVERGWYKYWTRLEYRAASTSGPITCTHKNFHHHHHSHLAKIIVSGALLPQQYLAINATTNPAKCCVRSERSVRLQTPLCSSTFISIRAVHKFCCTSMPMYLQVLFHVQTYLVMQMPLRWRIKWWKWWLW